MSRVLLGSEEEEEESVNDAVEYLEKWYSGGTYPLEEEEEGERDAPVIQPVNSATARLHAAALAKKRNTPAAALRTFVNDEPLLETVQGNMRDVSALDYWIGEQRKVGGHGRDPLVDLAVDIFTCPASTVDVERVFSRGRRTVGDFQHRLAPTKIADLINVAYLYNEGMIKPGMLARAKAKKDAEAKAKSGQTRSIQAAFARQEQQGKGKAKEVVLSESEEEEAESTDEEMDSDVPMPGVGEKGEDDLFGEDYFCFSASEE